MVSKPTTLPKWAENDVQDPVSGQYNVIEPPPEKQLSGWARLEFPPRNWFNWLARFTYRWLQWLDQQESQSRTVDNTGADAVCDTTTGGLCKINIIDTTTPANSYVGIAYVPPSPGGPITITKIGGITLTVSTISAVGIMTVAGGSGNYIINGQMKTIP